MQSAYTKESAYTKDKKPQGFDQFAEDLQNGNIAGVERYFDMHDGCGHVTLDKVIVVQVMIEHPEQFTKPLDVFHALTKKDFSFETLFKFQDGTVGKPIQDPNLWTMYAESAKPDVAKVAAILIAEEMRHIITQNATGYKFDVQSLLQKKPGTLSAESEKTNMQNSLIATQNALVDYIREDGDTLVATRGAAFLKIMGTDLPPNIYQMTTQKITGFDQRRLESLRSESFKTVPVYEPFPS
jgi:hypothetical protein